MIEYQSPDAAGKQEGVPLSSLQNATGNEPAGRVVVSVALVDAPIHDSMLSNPAVACASIPAA